MLIQSTAPGSPYTYYINIDHIEYIESHQDGDNLVHMANGAVIRVSDAKRIEILIAVEDRDAGR